MAQMSLDLEEDKLADRQSDGRDSYPADDEATFGYYKDSRGRKVARMIDPHVAVAPEEERAREMRAERRAMRRNPPAPAGQKPGGLILDSSDEGGGLLPPPSRQQPVQPAAQQQVPQAPQRVAQAPAAPANKKAGPSRSKFIDGTTEVLDQAVDGLDKFKDVKDAGVALGTELPKFADALGNEIPGMRHGMDNLLEQYAPEQAVMQDVAKGISDVHKKFDTLGIKDNPVKTAKAIKLASGLLKIRQYQRNEGKDISGVNRHQKENLRDQLLLFQQSRREREGAKLLQGRIGSEGYDRNDEDAASDIQAMNAAAEGMRKQALGKMWQRGARAALGAQSLAKANQKKGVRPLNELSMEKTAYLNDKGFVPQKPLGLFNGTSSTPAFVPKKGMLVGKDAWGLTMAADRSHGARPADPDNDDPGDQVQGDDILRNDPKRRDITRVNTLENPDANRELAAAFGRQDYVEPDAAGMRDLTPEEKAARGGEGYREETDEGRAMQKKLKPVDFMAGTGRLLEGTLNTDRMVRDGRYGAAYGAKVADFAVNTGMGMGIKGVQGGLMASAGPLAAPLISIGEVGKKAVLHAKEELGRGVQTGAEFIRDRIDPQGLGKAQDNKDTWNAFYGHSRPDVAPEANVDVPDPDAQGGPQDSTETSESFDDLRQDLDEKAALEENDRQMSELKAAQLAGDNVTTNARLRAITPGVANQQRALAGTRDGAGVGDANRHSGTGSEIEEWARYDDENDRGFQPDPLAAKELLDVSQDDEGIQPKGDASGFVDTSFKQLIDEAQDDSQSDGLSSISEEDASQESDDSQAGQAPEKVSARMDDVLERGYLPEKQGSADVLGRRKRTWGRFAFDNTLGLAGKLAKGVGKALVGAVKAPFKLAAWGLKGIGWLGKQVWKGLKWAGSGLKSRFTKKAPAPAPKTAAELETERQQKAQKLKDPAVQRMQSADAQQAAAEGDSAATMRRLLGAELGSNPNEKVARKDGDIDLAYQQLQARVRNARQAAAVGGGQGQAPGQGPIQGPGPDPGNNNPPGGVVPAQVTNNRKFKNALFDESDSSVEKMPAEPQKQAQDPGVAPSSGQRGGQEVPAKRRDSYGRRVEEWQAKADAARMGLIMGPEDPWLQANPFPTDRPNLPDFDEKEDYSLPVDAGGSPAKAMESQGHKPASVSKASSPSQGPVMKQLINGQWQEQPEEEKGSGPVPQGSGKGNDEKAPFQDFWKGTRHHYGPGPDDYFEYDESAFKPKGVAREDAGTGSPPVKDQDPLRHEPVKDASALQKKDASPARRSVHDGAWLRQQRKSAETREASVRAQARKDAAGRSIPKTADRPAFNARPSMNGNGALESSGRREYPLGENEVPIAAQDDASTSERLRAAKPRRPSNVEALFDKALPLQGRRLDDLTEEERAVGIAAMDVDRMRQQAQVTLDQDSRTAGPLADIAEADREEDVELPADLNSPWQVPGAAPRRPAESDALAGLQLPPPPKKPGFFASSKTRARYGQEQLARSRQVEAMKADALAQQDRQHSAALDAHRSGVDAYASRKKVTRDAITGAFDQAIADRDVTAPEAVRKSAFGGLMWETLSQVYVRDHMPDLLSGGGRLPETVAAEQRVAEAVEKESASSQPFSRSAGGRYAGELDASHDRSQGGKAVPRLEGASAAGGVGVGNMLFGAPRAQGPQVSTAALEDLTTLTSNMDSSHTAERARMHQAGQQVRADQGDLAMPMPGLRPGAEVFRAPFFNAYWNQEIQHPNPTRQATHSRKVRFDDSADQQVPMDQRPPDRPFAVRQQHDHAQKLRKRSALRAAGEQAKMQNPDVWAGMEAAGELVHEREKKRVFPGNPPPVLQQPPSQHQAPQQPPASVQGAQQANEEEKVSRARPLPDANTGRAGEVGDGAANLPSARKIDDLFRRGRSPVVPYDDAAFANRVSPAYDVYDDEPAKYQADLRAEGFQDVSTRHEDLDLPSAYVHVPEESEDLPDWVSSFSGPGGELDIADSPEGATSGGYQALSANEVHEKRQARAARKAALPSNYLDDKRVLDTAGSLTPDALEHSGPITVDGREVYPQYPNRDKDADRPFGGHWRHADTGQRVQDATVHGARDNPPYAEFHGPAIPAERVLQVPAPGWDAKPNKPGLLSGKSAKESYARAKQARADVVRSAFDAYQRKELERPPRYIGESEYAKGEWRRLDAVAAEQKQRALMRQRGMMLF